MIVYIVLQTPYFDERALRSYLTRLVVTLEARVVNSSLENHDGPPGHEIIYSGSVDPKQDPLIIVQGPDEEDNKNDEGHVLVLWKQSVVINRPARLRLQSPSVVFSATASLKPAEQVLPEVREDEYLLSQTPSGLNLLESFSSDPDLGGIVPRLSALRVSRVVPATQVAIDLLRPLKNISRRSVKVYPAFSVRVRYARPITIPTNPSITASLDIDITPFAGHEVVLEIVKLTVNEGRVEDLNNVQGMALPMVCLPRDDVTFLYRIKPDDQETIKTNIKLVQILVTAFVKISPTCSPQISMHWQTSVDFTPPLNSSFGTPSQPIRRDHRPAQLSIDSAPSSAISGTNVIPTISSLALTHPNPDALPDLDAPIRHQRTTSFPDFGVTITFIDSSATISSKAPGEEFTWQVFIVNRSSTSRKLALLVIPRHRRSNRPANTNRPQSTSTPFSRSGRDPSVADAFTDENILHAQQRNAAAEPAELICYSTDVRVGPLAPAACHVVELRFMPLVKGVIGLDAVRVIDLGSQEHVDVRDLPTIIVG